MYLFLYYNITVFFSFVGSNEPMKNGCEVIYEMFHILNVKVLIFSGFYTQLLKLRSLLR